MKSTEWDRREVKRNWSRLLFPNVGECLPYANNDACLLCNTRNVGERWRVAHMRSGDLLLDVLCRRCWEYIEGGSLHA